MLRISTINFDTRTPPKIPHMRTFFRSAFIFPELLGVSEPDNMALVFHEALHAYTRLPDFSNPLNPSVSNLKAVLGCDTNQLGTYDITAYLKQFTTEQLLPNPRPCSYFAPYQPPPDGQVKKRSRRDFSGIRNRRQLPVDNIRVKLSLRGHFQSNLADFPEVLPLAPHSATTDGPILGQRRPSNIADSGPVSTLAALALRKSEMCADRFLHAVRGSQAAASRA